MSGLDARIEVDRGGFRLRLELQVAAGSTLAVVGRNGAGKSTLLDALAGLVPLDAGSVRLDGTTLDDEDVFVPPDRRPVGLVLQAAVLFPHLSVLDNVAFGLRMAGTPRRAARIEAMRTLEGFGLGALADRRPSTLSGGQAARVALARALVRRPRLLLLDEPLAAVDALGRPALRERLAADLAAFDGCCILVTHDVADAETLADEVVVLEAGGVLQRGPLAALRASPVDQVVGRLLGAPGTG